MADESAASIREVHALLDTAEAKLSAQISDLKREMLLQFERHEVTHKDEERTRRARVRWAVTTHSGSAASPAGSSGMSSISCSSEVPGSQAALAGSRSLQEPPGRRPGYSDVSEACFRFVERWLLEHREGQ